MKIKGVEIPKDYTIQARKAVEQYFEIEKNGKVFWFEPVEENDQIPVEYVVRCRITGDCWEDEADYETLDEALEYFKEK